MVRVSVWIAATICMLMSLSTPLEARCEDWVPQPKPQNASRDIVGQDIDQIMDRGFMEFAVYDDFPPYSWKEGSTPKGVDVDIAKLIAAYIGVDARFTFVNAGENLDADLRNNVWRGPIVGGRVSNVMMRVPYDSEYACRHEQVVFTGQYYMESVAIAYDKASYPEDKPVPAYFRFDTVAVENDSIADFYLSSTARGQLMSNIKRYPTMAEAMAALDAGEVMAVMGPRLQLEYGQTGKIGIHEPPLAGFSRSSWTIGLGVNFRYRPLAYSVDDAILDALNSGKIEAVFADYGLSHRAPER